MKEEFAPTWTGATNLTKTFGKNWTQGLRESSSFILGAAHIETTDRVARRLADEEDRKYEELEKKSSAS